MEQIRQIRKRLEKLLPADAILMQMDAVQMQLSSHYLELDSNLWHLGTFGLPSGHCPKSTEVRPKLQKLRKLRNLPICSVAGQAALAPPVDASGHGRPPEIV